MLEINSPTREMTLSEDLFPLPLRKHQHLKEGRKDIGLGAAAAPAQPPSGSVALSESDGPQFPHLRNDMTERDDLRDACQPCLSQLSMECESKHLLASGPI